jgi:hypothetical protein
VQTISHLLEQLVASLLTLSILLQDENNSFQTCQQLGTSSVNISCWQAVRFLHEYCSHLTPRTSPVSVRNLFQGWFKTMNMVRRWTRITTQQIATIFTNTTEIKVDIWFDFSLLVLLNIYLFMLKVFCWWKLTTRQESNLWPCDSGAARGHWDSGSNWPVHQYILCWPQGIYLFSLVTTVFKWVSFTKCQRQQLMPPPRVFFRDFLG